MAWMNIPAFLVLLLTLVLRLVRFETGSLTEMEGESSPGRVPSQLSQIQIHIQMEGRQQTYLSIVIK